MVLDYSSITNSIMNSTRIMYSDTVLQQLADSLKELQERQMNLETIKNQIDTADVATKCALSYCETDQITDSAQKRLRKLSQKVNNKRTELEKRSSVLSAADHSKTSKNTIEYFNRLSNYAIGNLKFKRAHPNQEKMYLVIKGYTLLLVISKILDDNTSTSRQNANIVAQKLQDPYFFTQKLPQYITQLRLLLSQNNLFVKKSTLDQTPQNTDILYV